MNFTKLEGCANDFIVTHEITNDCMNALIEKAPFLCDRRRGIGADGVIAVLPSKIADFAMRIINADGSEPEMCGNGIRCFAVYLRAMGLTTKNSLTVQTKAGIITPEFVGNNIRVNMGRPILEANRVPVARTDSNRIIMETISVDKQEFVITAVSMGNPHAVIFTDTLSDDLVLNYGKKIECHPFFPRKVNVEFITVLSDTETRMRVYERGCGETMACGTGACASVVAGILNKKHGNTVTVHLLGGNLLIEWDGNPEHPVFMTGPANAVFSGSIDL